MSGKQNGEAPGRQAVTSGRDAYVAGRDLHVHLPPEKQEPQLVSIQPIYVR